MQEMSSYIINNYDYDTGGEIEYSGADILLPTNRNSTTASLNGSGNLDITWKVNSLYDFDPYTGDIEEDSKRITKLSYQGLSLTIEDGLSSYLATVGAAKQFYTEAQWSCTK